MGRRTSLRRWRGVNAVRVPALIATLAVTIALAIPVSAEWSINGTTAIWRHSAPLAVAQEARDAILWDRSTRPLLGAVFTAASANLTMTDLGNGQGRIAIAMPRAGAAGADNWIADYAAVGCGTGLTQQQILACVDAAIKEDVRDVIRRYRHHLREQTAPVVEPDFGTNGGVR